MTAERIGQSRVRRDRLNTWGGALIAVYGTAHTLGALFVLGAVRHAGTWTSGKLWAEDLTDMSPAMSAYWLSVASFGPPLILVGATVLWLNRRGITPPSFIAWVVLAWLVLDIMLAGPGVGQGIILLAGTALLLLAAQRAKRRDRVAVAGWPAGQTRASSSRIPMMNASMSASLVSNEHIHRTSPRAASQS